MRYIPLALVAPAVLFVATGAMAGTTTKSGEVKSIDKTKHELVLSSGDTFELNKSVKVDQIKAGTKVSISYEAKNGKNFASRVTTVR